MDRGFFVCYQNSDEQPTVSFTNTLCCTETIVDPPPSDCYEWDYYMNTNGIGQGNSYLIAYIDCNDEQQQLEFYENQINEGTICVKQMQFIDYNGLVCFDYNPPQGSDCLPIILGQNHPDGFGSYVTSVDLITCNSTTKPLDIIIK